MSYELTEIDFIEFDRLMNGATAPFSASERARLRRWFATLPVVAAETPESARKGPSEDWLRRAGDAEDAAGGFPSAGGLAADLGLHKAPTPESAEPPLATRTTVRDGRFGDAETWDVEATKEDAREFRAAINREHNRQADMGEPFDVDLATCAAPNAVYRRMRARERPAPSGPDPLAKPTKEEIDRAWERYLNQEYDTYEDIRYLLTSFVADRRKSVPSSAPEPPPPPPAADYMVYQPDGIEFRSKGDGQHDPVVATVTAEAFWRAMRAAGVIMERGGEE